VKLDVLAEGRRLLEAGPVGAAARVLNPLAFGPRYELGCGGGWHYEAHSFHSICSCGNGDWEDRQLVEQRQSDDQRRAKKQAKRALTAALARLRKEAPGGEA
jgi:hypothetical protein